MDARRNRPALSQSLVCRSRQSSHRMGLCLLVDAPLATEQSARRNYGHGYKAPSLRRGTQETAVSDFSTFACGLAIGASSGRTGPRPMFLIH